MYNHTAENTDCKYHFMYIAANKRLIKYIVMDKPQ